MSEYSKLRWSLHKQLLTFLLFFKKHVKEHETNPTAGFSEKVNKNLTLTSERKIIQH